MEQKQYLAMAEIMAECRKFALQMYTKMMEAGLLVRDKYHLEVNVGNTQRGNDTKAMAIFLEPDICSENWYEDRMQQENIIRKGWVVMHDPIAKDGTVPFDFCPYGLPSIVCYSQKDGCLGKEKTRTNAVGSCNSGMWFHDDDGDLPMADRSGVNGNLADG